MFNGRYGMDKLNTVLMWTGVGISVLGLVLRRGTAVSWTVSILSWAFLITAILRMLSRNFYARSRELEAYLRFEARVRSFFSGARRSTDNVINLNRERRKYKYLACPQCMQKLRVPKGKGKLRVTCTKCGCKFDARS